MKTSQSISYTLIIKTASIKIKRGLPVLEGGLFVLKCLFEVFDCCLFNSDCPAPKKHHSSD